VRMSVRVFIRLLSRRSRGAIDLVRETGGR
jgi:hypothetical protein